MGKFKFQMSIAFVSESDSEFTAIKESEEFTKAMFDLLRPAFFLPKDDPEITTKVLTEDGEKVIYQNSGFGFR